jgi:hypothetical protein
MTDLTVAHSAACALLRHGIGVVCSLVSDCGMAAYGAKATTGAEADGRRSELNLFSHI